MAIINYYEKYGISQTDELEKIQWVINQKITDEENDSFGEGHSDKMFFLESAKKAFATAESRAKYDQDLADSMRKKDPDGERKAQFDKWYADAKNYFKTQQYDLAKSAIERAFQYKSSESDNSEFYRYAAAIYSSVESHSQAIDYANQAIVLEPEICDGYHVKASVLERYITSQKVRIQSVERADLEKQLLKTVHLMCEKAIKANIPGEASVGYGWLAWCHYYWDGCKDQIEAEELAHLSIFYGNENSDAKKVLDDIAARRAKAAELKKQNVSLQSKLKRDNEKLQSENIRLNDEISSLKGDISYANDRTSDQMSFIPSAGASLGCLIPICIFIAVVGLIVIIIGATISSGDSGFAGFIILAAGGMALIARGTYVASSKNIHSVWDSIRGKEAASSQNGEQIRNNEYNTNNTIKNNNSDISALENGLAKQPFRLNADAQLIKNLNIERGEVGERMPHFSEVDVVLTGVGASKIGVIKVVRELTGLGLREAKDLVDAAPKIVKEKVSKADAEDFKRKLEAAGAKVEIK